MLKPPFKIAEKLSYMLTHLTEQERFEDNYTLDAENLGGFCTHVGILLGFERKTFNVLSGAFVA